MRPLRVELHAFGPYPKVQVIDFRELGSHPLFLITGPTGSGKTSVLDGMCFALFGEATGGDRPVDRLRSDHADNGTPTLVRFDFELGGKGYRIERAPKQERPKKRGTGTVSEAAKATLWERSLTADDAEDGEVLITRHDQIAAKVEELLGFKADQFRQVMMIPQGEFRRLLSAQSGDRERILSTLFGTGRFKRLADELRARHWAIKKRLDTSDIERKTLHDSAGVESLEQLGGLIQTWETKVAVAKVESGKLEAISKKTAAALQAGKLNADRLLELNTARQEVGELAKRKSEIDGQRNELERAGKAKGLRATAEHHGQRGGELGDAKKARDEALGLLDGAKVAKDDADKALTEERKRDEQRAAAQKRIGELEAHAGKAEKLAGAQNATQEAASALTLATGEEKTAEGDLAEKKVKAEAGRTAVEETRATAAGLDGAKKAAEAASKGRSDRQTYETKRIELATLTTQADKTKAKLEDDETLVASARETLTLVRQAWDRGQAAVLARGLAEGAPCPVCGSTEHPEPATADESVPEEVALKSGEKTLQGAEKNRDASRREADRVTGLVTALTAAIETLRDGLGDEAGTPLDELEGREKDAKGLLAAAEQADKGLPGLEQASTTAAEAVTAADKGLTAARKAREAATTALEKAKTRETTVAESLPEELRGAGALNQAIEAEKTKLDALKAALDSANSTAQAAGEALATAKTGAAGTEKNLKKATDLHRKAAEKLKEAIAEASFKDEEDYQGARREDGSMDVLDLEIRAWDEATTRADTRLKTAEKKAKGVEKPDLEGLETAATGAADAHAASLKQLGEMQGEVKTLKGHQTALQKIEEARKADLEAQKTIGRLATAAEGKNGANMTFERFVLAAFLENVLQAATARLRRMSAGRYTLHRATGFKDGRKKGGLDLEVLDAYTGRARPVGTLSGGEGFEASLALALGLADTVQAQSGGIHLDAIFVDEGFGSLGQEDLDAVMNALEDLQEGGRLVGVISHVAELAERVTARLVIDKGHDGSSARFVVP
jgi:exonuclease SbcC